MQGRKSEHPTRLFTMKPLFMSRKPSSCRREPPKNALGIEFLRDFCRSVVGSRGGIRVFDEPEKPEFRFRIPLFPPKKTGKSGSSGFYA